MIMHQLFFSNPVINIIATVPLFEWDTLIVSLFAVFVIVGAVPVPQILNGVASQYVNKYAKPIEPRIPKRSATLCPRGIVNVASMLL